jgi:hypothetical protein
VEKDDLTRDQRLKREQTLMREIEDLKKQIAAKSEDQVTSTGKLRTVSDRDVRKQEARTREAEKAHAEEKQKLDGVDESWAKFNDDLDKANQIIKRCHQSLKTEVDNQIEDFKKECQDNKKNFQLQAPYAYDKTQDNKAAFEKIQEFKNATQELRDQEE